MSDYLNETISNYLDNAEDGEGEAINLFHYLRERFGWTGTFMTREDVETVAERKLTDEEWKRVEDTKPWRDWSSIVLETGGWEPVYMALDEANVPYGDDA
jgi:hypothetical protein